MKSKRIIPVLILLIIIVYLAIYLVKDIPNNNGVSYSNTTNVKANENKNTTKEVWKDNNPIKVGLYYNDKTAGKRVLKNTHTANFEYHKDIISFNAFFTDEKEISNGNLINIYESYVNKYNEDISSYRIGYIVEFNNNSYQIIRPKDTESFYDTLEVYLYDAIAHKNDSWYSHTTDDEFNKNTLLQGIKLTAGKKVNDITTDIKVTVFTYDEDDFDEKGIYKGISKYTLSVQKS